MTKPSIKVSEETRKKLNRFRANYDITQDEAISRLIDERGRIEQPCVTTCDAEGCDVKLAFEHPPRDYDKPHVYCDDCRSKLVEVNQP